jgi:hypothetical protein
MNDSTAITVIYMIAGGIIGIVGFAAGYIMGRLHGSE